MYDDDDAIFLDHYEGELTLIVQTSDGKKYTNQTGGCSCDHPVTRGYIIQLNGNSSALSAACNYSCYVDESNLLKVQRILDNTDLQGLRLKVTHGMNQEAWLQVEIEGCHRDWNGETQGILTWNNSD